VKRVRVLSVASEFYPLVKTGGLADVVGALPGALAGERVTVRTLIPGYPAVLAALKAPEIAHEWPELFGGPARLMSGRIAGQPRRAPDLFALDAPHLYQRPGGPYADSDGRDWPDNALRFAALARAAADVGRGAVAAFQSQVVHAHDWQAGFAPAYLHYDGGARPASVMTVHNLAFQGQFSADLLEPLGLPRSAWSVDGVEYYGGIGFLKSGLQFADRITTVSPSYAVEIRAPGGGMGLEGLLHSRAAVLSGILNGIDDGVWDPAQDTNLTARFDADRVAARAANKATLQERLRLAVAPGALLFGVISRLTWQKGMDLLLDALPALLRHDAQLALLGAGDAAMEQGFATAAAAHPGRIGVRFGYDEELAHLIQGGADAVLVPSRYEPCGLTQLCALRYGALPVVSRVGGLADTVIDASEMALAAGVATGFQFAPVTATALEAAIDRAAALWRDRPAWRRMQQNAMATDVGWTRPARHYAALYRELAGIGASAANE
jgi:starch synthase